MGSTKSDNTKPNHTFDKMIGEKVKQLRILKKISIADMAKMLGIHERHLYKHENGVFWFSAGRLLLIAKVLNVPISYFYKNFSNKYISKVMKNSIGFKIKELRKSNYLKIVEVSKYLEITAQQLYNYENDVTNVPISITVKLAALFQVDPQYLLENTEYIKQPIPKEIENKTKPLSVNKVYDRALTQALLFTKINESETELIGKAIDETLITNVSGWGLKNLINKIKTQIKG
jgi:transcriptional regulator with XRE-family HTH domain